MLKYFTQTFILMPKPIWFELKPQQYGYKQIGHADVQKITSEIMARIKKNWECNPETHSFTLFVVEICNPI